MDEIYHIITHATMVTTFVFVMMVITDFVNVITKGNLKTFVTNKKWGQYTIASALGAVPGCTGSFMSVSMYCHGFLSFGAITACMIATSGDAAFVMLSLFPLKSLLIFISLFFIGIIFAPIIDLVFNRLKLDRGLRCNETLIHSEHEEENHFRFKSIKNNIRDISFSKFLLIFFTLIFLVFYILGVIGPEEWNWGRISMIVLLSLLFLIELVSSEHFIQDHIWVHTIKKHIGKVFLWTLLAMFFIHLGTEHAGLSNYIKSNPMWMVLLAALVGIIPDSGPHIMFVSLFSQGLVPLSVLITSCIVQDGHGLLPMLSMSLKDSIYIKIVNFIIGLLIGFLLYFLGL